jgi:hypothetical protein
MLKPKYVHGVSANEGSQSLLHRLQQEASHKAAPLDPDDVNDVDPLDGSGGLNWGFILG